LSEGLDDLNGRVDTPRTLRGVARMVVKLALCRYSLDTNTTNMTELGQWQAFSQDFESGSSTFMWPSAHIAWGLWRHAPRGYGGMLPQKMLKN